MRARKLILVAVLAFAGIITLAYLWGRLFASASPHPNQPAAPRLVVADGYDNFRTVWLTDRFEWQLPLRNAEGVSLQVDSIALSCSCISVTPHSFTLAPGEEITLRLVIDLTAKRTGPDEDRLFFLSPSVRRAGGEKLPLQWTLRGRVRDFVTSAHPITFGRSSTVAPNRPAGSGFTTAEPIPAGFDVQVNQPSFSATVTTDARQPTNHHLRVTHTGPRAPSDISLEVRLSPRGTEGRHLPPVVFPVGGQIVRDVEPVPAAVLAGGVPVGETHTHSVTLVSVAGKPFDVLGCVANGEGLSVSAEGGEYRVTQRGLRPGAQSGRVDFHVKAADGEYIVPLPVSYSGVAR